MPLQHSWPVQGPSIVRFSLKTPPQMKHAYILAASAGCVYAGVYQEARSLVGRGTCRLQEEGELQLRCVMYISARSTVRVRSLTQRPRSPRLCRRRRSSTRFSTGATKTPRPSTTSPDSLQSLDCQF